MSNPQTLDTIILYYPNTVFQTSQFVLHSFGVHLLVHSQANKKGHVFKKKDCHLVCLLDYIDGLFAFPSPNSTHLYSLKAAPLWQSTSAGYLD